MAYNSPYQDRRDSRDNGPTVKELATRILVPVISIDFSNPPSIPSLATPVELDDSYPYICAVAASELIKGIDVTPAHLFLYNITANNSFRNDDFDGIVKVIIECIDKVMTTSRGTPDLTATIKGVARDVVDGVASLTANNAQELGGILEDRDWDILDEAERVYAALKPSNQQQSRRGYSGGSRQSYTSTSRRETGRPMRSANDRSSSRDNDRKRRDESSSDNDTARRRTTSGSRSARSAQPQEETKVDNTTQRAPSAPVALHWRSTPKQQYRPLYNLRMKEEILQPTAEGIISVSKPREEVMEDYAAHTTAMGARAIYASQKDRNKVVDAAMDAVEAAAVTETILLNQNNLPAFYSVPQMFAAQLLLDHTMRKTDDDTTRAVATSHGGAYYHLNVEAKEQNSADTYSWLAASRSFEQLGQRVLLLLNGNGDKYVLSGEQARYLDAQLTTEFSRLLRRQLMIEPSELSIDSFATDIVDLIAIFNKNEIYKTILPRMHTVEKEFITRNTFILSGEYRAAVIRNIEEIRIPLPSSSESCRALMVLQAFPTVSALIDLCANELCIDIDIGQTRALIASEHRQLAALVSGLVDMVNPVTMTRSSVTICTLDCYEFELDKGLLGDHYYLVTRVR